MSQCLEDKTCEYIYEDTSCTNTSTGFIVHAYYHFNLEGMMIDRGDREKVREREREREREKERK